jgi:hypothetical protein
VFGSRREYNKEAQKLVGWEKRFAGRRGGSAILGCLMYDENHPSNIVFGPANGVDVIRRSGLGQTLWGAGLRP